jgi:hypothetical protein
MHKMESRRAADAHNGGVEAQSRVTEAQNRVGEGLYASGRRFYLKYRLASP